MSLKEQLDANIPRDVIETRQQSGKQLSYLPGWYVIDRLNQVLGTENWTWAVQNVLPVAGDKQAYIVQGRLTALINNERTAKEGMGYGADKGSYNPGEMAIKEAETDALKRAAMKLGRSLGLALYDKTQEYVDDESSNDVAKGAAKETKAVRSVGSGSNSASSKGSQSNGGGVTDTKVLKSQIKNAFAVLQAQKKISKDDFVKDYTAGVKVDDLSDASVKTVLAKLKQNYPELGL